MYGKVMRSSATVRSNFSASAAKPGRADVDDQRRERDAERGDDEQREREQGRDVVDQQPGLVGAAPGLVLGEDGHERLRERALGEQAPQQVGNAEGDEERVGLRAPRRRPAR